MAGILEPAYSIGGDSFDYALNPAGLEFAIVDAMGHGMSAVLMSAVAINGLRNVRREGRQLVDGYEQVDQLLVEHFGDFRFVTGQFGSLDSETVILRWINAGHPLPLLVRNATFVGELWCEPSKPMGLGGTSWRSPKSSCRAATGCCSTPMALLIPRAWMANRSAPIGWPTTSCEPFSIVFLQRRP